MNEIIIIGCGGLGTETAELIHHMRYGKIVGFLDDNVEKHGQIINGIPVLGSIDKIKNYQGINVAVAIANPAARQIIVSKIQKYCNFPIFVHPSVFIPGSSVLGRGTIVFANSVISVNVTIGEHVIVSPKCGIGHGSVICSFSSLMWNVNVSGDTMIMAFNYLGTNCTILQGLTIEPYCKIGAGAVVINNVEKMSTMVGIPARKTK